MGGTAPATVSGADEVAVGLFLEGKIGFLDIGKLVSGALEQAEIKEIRSVSDVLEAVGAAGEYVLEAYKNGL